jgi:hypothetical protein
MESTGGESDSFTKGMAELKAFALNAPPLYFVFELKLT